MSTIAYFHTRCGLSANLGCRSEMCCTPLAENTGRKSRQKIAICAPSTTLSGYIFATKARIDNQKTRRPASVLASADRTARRQFLATGQPVSRKQEVTQWCHGCRDMRRIKCVQRRCFQWGSVPLRSDIKGTELPLPIYIDTTRKAIDCATTLPLFYIMKFCSRILVLYCRNLYERRQS